MDSNLLILLLILILIIVVVTAIVLFTTRKNNNTENMTTVNNVHQLYNNPNVPLQLPFLQIPYVNQPSVSYNYIPRYDVVSNELIRKYDMDKLIDPYTSPTRRVARYEIPPEYMKRMIDLPTRGYPDNYILLGTLVNDNTDKSDPNHILRLYGRREFPGSKRYEYYTAINSGLDQIKVPLRTRNRQEELYDGDKVKVKELDDYYKVNLYPFDQPKYYPDLL